MSPGITAAYASPGLRWGLLLEDHPGAKHDFSRRRGVEIGIDEEVGGGGWFCVATISFPQRDGEAKREDVIGYKPLAGKVDADAWDILCTKALGRALKRAGYPAHLPDLKALVLWRQRNAEVQAITAGHQSVPALPPASTDDVLDEAGHEDEVPEGDDEPVEVEVVE